MDRLTQAATQRAWWPIADTSHLSEGDVAVRLTGALEGSLVCVRADTPDDVLLHIDAATLRQLLTRLIAAEAR